MHYYIINYKILIIVLQYKLFPMYVCVCVCIYFWMRWVFVAARGLSLVATSEGLSLLRYVSFSLQWLLLLQSMNSRRVGFSSCGARA